MNSSLEHVANIAGGKERVDAMSTLFHRLKEVQIGEPIWQPVIFAILIMLISVTLYFIFAT
jgi:hypothetical protein